MTAHIEAKIDDIAKTVIMPGDPLRAKFIAENFLADPILYNSIRGMLGYTGYYKNKRVSVQGSGMGIPSMGIYAYELYKFYNVDNIIRVGTAGGISDGVNLRDIVIAQGASTNSNFASQYNLPGHIAPIASYSLLKKSEEAASKLNIKTKIGNILTSDTFYGDDGIESMVKWKKMGILAIEMEAAGLYLTASSLNKNALSILTISDLIFENKQTTPDERQSSFIDMIKIALETIN